MTPREARSCDEAVSLPMRLLRRIKLSSQIHLYLELLQKSDLP